ncbi:MAG: flagellar hook-associated protein FlgL [Acidimicrobiales bacterium]
MSSAFRITNRSISQSAMAGLQANLGRMQKLNEQLSSGRQVNRPSDSPVATSSAMQFRSQLRQTEQYARNAQDGISWLGAIDDTLTTMLGSGGRVRQLILTGLNATSGPAEREALAAEVDTLRSSLLDTANSTYLNRPLFAGTADVGAAYDRVTGSFLGNTGDEASAGAVGKVERSVAPGVTLRVNLTGPEIFGDQGAGDDLFAVLERVSTNLRAGDTAALSEDLASLDGRMEVVLNQLAKVGARYHQVETMRNRAENNLITLTSGLSEVEDIDMPKTIVDLQLQEVAYKAALSATAKVIQPSLLDFLR